MISSKDGKRSIYIDSEHKVEISAYIQQDKRHQKKFKFISDIILGGYTNSAVYGKEAINENCKAVTAMKFFKGQENDRIYCKEIITETGVFIVVAAILHKRKKSNGLSPKEKTLINKIGGYHYEI